ncbi:hypothetical protein NOCARDAX2BIS_230209 [Nocardioides sp. AX2bis]|nr:hypothetical protein NOCARDAX2BIS_230209 [Nocardioides sp. AX2bis]
MPCKAREPRDTPTQYAHRAHRTHCARPASGCPQAGPVRRYPPAPARDCGAPVRRPTLQA